MQAYIHFVAESGAVVVESGMSVVVESWVVEPPDVVLKRVTVPGRDGTVEVSRLLTDGRPVFGDAKLTFDVFLGREAAPNGLPADLVALALERKALGLHGQELDVQIISTEEGSDIVPDLLLPWHGVGEVSEMKPLAFGQALEFRLTMTVGPWRAEGVM
ncbi:MAG: hypothetical protein LBN10_03370 [Propionibacteriaceae bacterium]|jgi:hypothetical protein|nr:hypothetical protein [Propionibacteriaceae bacterium]